MSEIETSTEQGRTSDSVNTSEGPAGAFRTKKLPKNVSNAGGPAANDQSLAAGARRGSTWAIVAAATICALVIGKTLHSGFGLPIDEVVSLAAGAIGISLVMALVVFSLTVFRKLPRLLCGLCLGTCLFLAVLWWPPVIGLVVCAAFVLTQGLLGAALGILFVSRASKITARGRALAMALGVPAIAANVVLAAFIASKGTTENVVRLDQGDVPAPAPLSAPNPGDPGTHSIKMLTYGSGSDLRRPEYGTLATIKTGSVDASQFFKEFRGWPARLRRLYWGFGMDKLPLNGRVWYPDGAGPFPLVLMVHGNYDITESSELGYGYLGELLASRGFIMVSVDENFLNSSFLYGVSGEQAARAWLLLEHLKLWHSLNASPGNPFFAKVNLDQVALMGHSRGGEAAATAVLFNTLQYYPDDSTIRFNYGFPITSVISMAPADGQYKPAGQWRYLTNVNYLTVQGSNDADEMNFGGSRQWEHVLYTQQGSWFKAELYIYGANHSQFNTVWGERDIDTPGGWLLNLAPLLRGEEQRRIAKTYISAFLEATLHNRREYLDVFRDYRRIPSWLPNTLYVSRYLDSSYKAVCEFNEDPNLSTTTVPGGRIEGENLAIWREGRIPYRQGDRDSNGVFLGWNNQGDALQHKATYTISLPNKLAKRWKVGSRSALTLSLAVADEPIPSPQGLTNDGMKKDGRVKPIDFTVELQTTDGVKARLPIDRFGILLPPFGVKFTKLSLFDRWLPVDRLSEPVFQTIELPMNAFKAQIKGFNPANVSVIRLAFDQTPRGVLIVNHIGFIVAENH
jgi:hypothetical protein